MLPHCLERCILANRLFKSSPKSGSVSRPCWVGFGCDSVAVDYDSCGEFFPLHATLRLVSQWPMIRLKPENSDSASGWILLYCLIHSSLFSL